MCWYRRNAESTRRRSRWLRGRVGDGQRLARGRGGRDRGSRGGGFDAARHRRQRRARRRGRRQQRRCDARGQRHGQRIALQPHVPRGPSLHLGALPLRVERDVHRVARVLRRCVRGRAVEHRQLRRVRTRVRGGAVLRDGLVLVDACVLAGVRRRARRALRPWRRLRVRRALDRVPRRASVHRGRVRSGVPRRMSDGRGVHGPRVRVRDDGRDVPRGDRVPQRSLPRPQRVRSALRRGAHVLQSRVRQHAHGHQPLRRLRQSLLADHRGLLRAVRDRQPLVHAGSLLLRKWR